MSKRWDYRDISVLLQSFRDFLMGRKHVLHGRFPTNLASRSIPPPDIPRGPDDKYYDLYYYKRNSFHSVMPPVVAPVGEGPALGKGIKPDQVCFPGLPTPGAPWGWDGHCYYECVPDPDTCPPCPPCPPPPPPPPCQPPKKEC